MIILLGLWRILDARQRRHLLWLQTLSIAMAVFTVGGIAAVVPFFSVLADAQSIHRSELLSALYVGLGFVDERGFVVALGLAFVGAIVMANLVNLLGGMALNRYAANVGDSLHVALFAEYLQREYRHHLTVDRSVLAGNVLIEVSRLTVGVLQSGLALVTHFFTTLLILASMLVLSPLVTAAAVAAIGGSYAAIYIVARAKLRESGQTQTRYLAERARIVDDAFGAIKDIAASQAQAAFVAKFAHACRRISSATTSAWATATAPRYVLECLAVVGLVGVAFLLSARVPANIWLAQLTFVGLAAYRLLPALQQAFGALVRLRVDRSALDSVAIDLLRARARITPSHAIDAEWRRRPRRDIVLTDITFAYDTGFAPTLKGLCMRIPAGAFVGIVGANGSGKTTLLDVLIGLLPPSAGTITVDDVEINAENVASWRSTLAYVSQRVVLTDDTIAANVAFGASSEDVDTERVREAVRLAHLDRWVATLPGGIDAKIGQNGSRLSGGYRQRIAIARALYRKASVLVLDEASSSLDGMTERELTDLLSRLKGDRTIVLVAHRQRALQNCDLIFELEDGRIARCGTPQLLTKERA